MVGTKAEDIKDYTTEDYNTEDTVEVTIETRPEGNTIFATRKDIGLQNIIPKTVRPLINDTIDNLYI
jgi:hypothetical protein